MHRLLWKDVRLLGALTALGLDVLWLALSVLLAAASVWFVAFPLFGSITGLVVAPLAGWRYGRAAACGQRTCAVGRVHRRLHSPARCAWRLRQPRTVYRVRGVREQRVRLTRHGVRNHPSRLPLGNAAAAFWAHRCGQGPRRDRSRALFTLRAGLIGLLVAEDRVVPVLLGLASEFDHYVLHLGVLLEGVARH